MVHVASANRGADLQFDGVTFLKLLQVLLHLLHHLNLFLLQTVCLSGLGIESVLLGVILGHHVLEGGGRG